MEIRRSRLRAGLPPSALVEAGNYITERLAGFTLSEAVRSMSAEIAAERAALDVAVEEVVARGIALLSHDGSHRPVLIIRGQAHLLDNQAIADIERVRQLMEELESKQELGRLLQNARTGDGMKIFIGSENKLFSLSGSSVITAPYFASDGKVVGVIGVIGPTRLNYARVIPMVDYTAQALTRLFA